MPEPKFGAAPKMALPAKPDSVWSGRASIQRIRDLRNSLAAAIMTAVSLWFLATWTSPDATNVGLAERVVATMQTGYLSLVILVCWFKGKRS